MKKLFLLSVFLFLVPSLDAEASKTFTFRLSAEPETLDWNRAHTPIETYLLMSLMEGLLTFDEKLQVKPALAERWERSRDGKIYTFHLRRGVKWSDGAPLKAQDFIYSWKRLLSPLTAASYAYLLFDIEGAEAFNQGKVKDFNAVGIRALDSFTLQIKLIHPVAHWINIPTFWVTFPLRQDVVEKKGESWARPGSMVTLGPFTLSIHDIDSKIVMKANPYYYGERGNIDEVVGLIVHDDSTALTLYEAGKLDLLTDISTLDLSRLKGRKDLKTFPYLKTAYLGFSTNRFPISNQKIRRAIAMAIDKRKIYEVLHGGQVPASSFVPPQMLAHSNTVGLPYHPIRAKLEFDSAGLEPGKTLKLEMVIPNWEKSLTLAQYVQSQLKTHLGIDLSIHPFDHKTFRSQLDLHVFPLFLLSWSADFPDPDNFLSLFLGAAGNNRTLWKNQDYDSLVLRARGLTQKGQREKAYLGAQKILLQDAAVIVPLYYEPNLALVRARVKGLALNPLNYLYLKKVQLSD